MVECSHWKIKDNLETFRGMSPPGQQFQFEFSWFFRVHASEESVEEQQYAIVPQDVANFTCAWFATILLSHYGGRAEFTLTVQLWRDRHEVGRNQVRLQAWYKGSNSPRNV